MHIAYSALRQVNTRKNAASRHAVANETRQQYDGYLAACKKHSQTIAAIQQYLPGWQPTFYYI